MALSVRTEIHRRIRRSANFDEKPGTAASINLSGRRSSDIMDQVWLRMPGVTMLSAVLDMAAEGSMDDLQVGYVAGGRNVASGVVGRRVGDAVRGDGAGAAVHGAEGPAAFT
jgi:hypothetical protein